MGIKQKYKKFRRTWGLANIILGGKTAVIANFELAEPIMLDNSATNVYLYNCNIQAQNTLQIKIKGKQTKPTNSNNKEK